MSLVLFAVSPANISEAQGNINIVSTNHYALSTGYGDFNYFQATFKVPSTDAILPGAIGGGCINHPVRIKYPNGGWVELGIAKCLGEPNGE